MTKDRCPVCLRRLVRRLKGRRRVYCDNVMCRQFASLARRLKIRLVLPDSP